MGKNENSIVVLRSQLKFWWMTTMGVKYNHTKRDQETQRWWPGTGFASGGPSFQNSSKMARKCLFFGQFGCLGCPWRGLFALESIEMINKHRFSVFCARLGASTTSFWAQNTAKSA